MKRFLIRAIASMVAIFLFSYLAITGNAGEIFLGATMAYYLIFTLKDISKSKLKFEYVIFTSHENHINENLKVYLDQGWEINGESYVKYHDRPTNATYIYIPLKRKLKFA
jgi:hypothetical protein